MFLILCISEFIQDIIITYNNNVPNFGSSSSVRSICSPKSSSRLWIPSGDDKDKQKEERNKKYKVSDVQSDTYGEDKTNKIDDTGQGLHLWPKSVPEDVMELIDTNKVYRIKVQCTSAQLGFYNENNVNSVIKGGAQVKPCFFNYIPAQKKRNKCLSVPHNFIYNCFNDRKKSFVLTGL